MGVNSLPETVTRQHRGGDLNPGPSAPESSTLTTRLPSRAASDRYFPPAGPTAATRRALLQRSIDGTDGHLHRPRRLLLSSVNMSLHYSNSACPSFRLFSLLF